MLNTTIDNLELFRFHLFAKHRGIKGIKFGMKKVDMIRVLVEENGITPEEILEFTNTIPSGTGLVGRARPKKEKFNLEVSHYEEPVVTKEPEAPVSKIAVYAKNRVAIHGVGIFEKGYHVIDKSVKDQVLRSKNMSAVDPAELAAFYGVA